MAKSQGLGRKGQDTQAFSNVLPKEGEWKAKLSGYAAIKYQDERDSWQNGICFSIIKGQYEECELASAWKNYRLEDDKSVQYMKTDMMTLGIDWPEYDADADDEKAYFPALNAAFEAVTEKHPVVRIKVTHGKSDKSDKTYANVRILALLAPSEAEADSDW